MNNNVNYYSNEDKNEFTKHIKNSYEKPMFIYNKSNILARWADMDNSSSSNLKNQKSNLRKNLNFNVNNDSDNNSIKI